MKVMVFGSFDALHDGHRDLFRQAKEHGDFLIVVVARDESIRRIKGHEPRNPEEERFATIALEPLVDEVVLGDLTDSFVIIEEERPDVLFLGYDQQTFSEERIHRELAARKLSPKVLRGESFHPEKYKSSLLG